MNWIGINPVPGENIIRGDPVAKPVSQTVTSKPIAPSHCDGWISARIESYRLRQEFMEDLVSAIQALVANNLMKARWLRIVRR
jgi:hypothetical protein|tara:strand:+ start:4726 stop:4974 length:249 start_codon:yes stop_codon:yes gene_type:complete